MAKEEETTEGTETTEESEITEEMREKMAEVPAASMEVPGDIVTVEEVGKDKKEPKTEKKKRDRK